MGILGLPRSGKTTLFEILLQGAGHGARGEQVGVVRVPDPRLDRLAAMFRPKKTTYAQLAFVDPAVALGERGRVPARTDLFSAIRNCDGLMAVVRAFAEPGDAAREWAEVDAEIVLNDLAIVEGRRDRLAHELRVGKKDGAREHALLERCHALLESGTPLRRADLAPEEHKLVKGFQLLSLKPCLVVWNRGEADPGALPDPGPGALGVPLNALAEREILSLPAEERAAFRAELGVAEDGLGLLIRKCYELLGLVSFFTIGEEELRAWTLARGERALDAAAAVHTDFARGFIRAEVIAYDRLVEAGSRARARERAWVRLEGKDYEVADGDVIEIRFSR